MKNRKSVSNDLFSLDGTEIKLKIACKVSTLAVYPSHKNFQSAKFLCYIKII